MAIERILVIDDEVLLRNFLAETLRRKNYDVQTAESGEGGIAKFKEQGFDLVITDMKMPDMTGIDVLKTVKALAPQTVVIVITAYGSVENAVEAMRLGAFNYLIKPFTPDTIEALIEKAKEHIGLVDENEYLRLEVRGKNSPSAKQPVFESPIMKKVIDDVSKVAKSNANIFITGESGTGKEVVAALIHQQSMRSMNPFIKVNCAAIPETLIESEFFGHEKGAFTGAHAKKSGRFELAHTGTLLLDEITEVPPMLQSKLLRVLQEQEFERVGGTKPIKVDVRVISTSNRNIKEAVEKKILREDLYFRLNVIPVHLPPLRERVEDIIPLANYFIEKFCLESHLTKKDLTERAKKKLLGYQWPGNVRELANVIERSVVMGSSGAIDQSALFLDSSEPLLERRGTHESSDTDRYTLPVGITLKELEKRLIIETLHAQNHNRKKTAEILDISVRTLRNKINEYRKEGLEILGDD